MKIPHQVCHFERRLIGTITPRQPTFCVYYDDATDSLGTEPVLFFSVWENRDKTDGEAVMESHPVVMDRTGLAEESRDTSNYLGLCTEENPRREAWEREIADCRASNCRASKVGMNV